MIATFMYICKFISPVTKFLIICESEFVKAIKIGYVTCMRNEKLSVKKIMSIRWIWGRLDFADKGHSKINQKYSGISFFIH